MDNKYAKVMVEGSPISKSNFKLFNVNGRAILPVNSGKYHDRYALYEQEIALKARIQNPNVVMDEALIAVLKVYYKSSKRHPDTNNITKSIFDGIEKSGLIVNDAQVRRLIIEEFYDKENPRFELELFAESIYGMNYNIVKKNIPDESILYAPPSNAGGGIGVKNFKKSSTPKKTGSSIDKYSCTMCGKSYDKSQLISINKGHSYLCKKCFQKHFK
ncbi:Endodeoxyribonuclease RusA [Hathewaya proteolytica DSM 3090]|uniref:Endodeoxyribonuclease RusA n=1 Tax=Hathewaya proteolytica DSM 3090 TaxID=1121331 RepID=A0A1M6RPW2_9CLOT|nr:RusA family crossover junction endodeoxyribonuclease [Hathewaya proteolytica]SHK34378.1 Endodeoxyribonuclease RusA [Hathewaya proteolytica DSM 3090]